MKQNNWDISAAGPVMLVDQPGKFPHEMILAAKTGTIYVINRDNMGHFHGGSDSQIIQSLPGVLPHGGQRRGTIVLQPSSTDTYTSRPSTIPLKPSR